MKAIVVESFGGPEVLEIKEVPKPSFNENEVLIETRKTSVNFADIKKRRGKKGGEDSFFIPGIDAVGVVVSVGTNVKDIKEGDRVVAFPSSGSYAEYVVASKDLTYVLPDKIDWDTAAASPIVSFLSYVLLNDLANLQEGENVLIHSAAGGVGTTAVQLAKILGANKVIGTVSSESKMSTVLEAGADHCLLYEDFSNQVNKLTNDTGVDIILDSVSGTVSEEGLECLAEYGRLVHFGNSSGEVGQFKTKDLHSSCRSILGFSLGNTRKKRPQTLKRVANEVFKLLEEEKLSIMVGEEFNLEEANKAHELIESRKSTGKILLRVK